MSRRPDDESDCEGDAIIVPHPIWLPTEDWLWETLPTRESQRIMTLHSYQVERYVKEAVPMKGHCRCFFKA